MSIIRSPRPSTGFSIIDNKIINDRRLTFPAKFALIYLLSKPDSWVISIADLRNQASESRKPVGRDYIYAIIQELTDRGYMRRIGQSRDESGKMSSAEYEVVDSPIFTVSDLPDTVEPHTADPTVVSTEVHQELIVAKEHSSPPATRSRFDEFWSAFPRKENKKKAEEVWKRKKLDSIADQIVADVTDRAARHKQWLDGFIPHPTTYLNGERWTDEIREAPLGGRGLVAGTPQMPQSKTGQALLDIQRFREELREEMGHEG